MLSASNDRVRRLLSREDIMAHNRSKTVRYAVVGLGHISQNAVLPAFAHAKRNSSLAALVSDDPVKLKTLSKKYHVKATYSYDQYEECLQQIDAVFVATRQPTGAPMPPGAKIAGACSLGIWVAVAACGRSIAYF